MYNISNKFYLHENKSKSYNINMFENVVFCFFCDQAKLNVEFFNFINITINIPEKQIVVFC